MVSAEKIKIDFQDVMRSYIWNKYLSHYFAHFQGRQYETLGAIVMNCNPFSKGHRYLIEQAGKQVEFLIVFAVEEDLSLFSFEERIRMIRKGQKICIMSWSCRVESLFFPKITCRNILIKRIWR